MSQYIKIEDLFSIAISKSPAEISEVSIKFSHINIFRNKLRERGFSYDMGLKEMETARCKHKNIVLGVKGITVIKEEQFVSYCRRRMKTHTENQIRIINEIWDETEKDIR